MGARSRIKNHLSSDQEVEKVILEGHKVGFHAYHLDGTHCMVCLKRIEYMHGGYN